MSDRDKIKIRLKIFFDDVVKSIPGKWEKAVFEEDNNDLLKIFLKYTNTDWINIVFNLDSAEWHVETAGIRNNGSGYDSLLDYLFSGSLSILDEFCDKYFRYKYKLYNNFFVRTVDYRPSWSVEDKENLMKILDYIKENLIIQNLNTGQEIILERR